MTNMLIFIGVLVFIYFLFWRLYLVVIPAIFSEFDFWKATPEFFKKPKFWQFFLIVFTIGTLWKKLDI